MRRTSSVRLFLHHSVRFDTGVLFARYGYVMIGFSCEILTEVLSGGPDNQVRQTVVENKRRVPIDRSSLAIRSILKGQ